jgi:hypothetical protein
MTGTKQRPADFVSACGATTVYGLGLPTAFGLRDDDTEVIAALGTGTGKVYGHPINLTLPVGALNTGASDCALLTKCFC